MSFEFGRRSLTTLNGVHPDLIKVARIAITISEVDFAVIHGLRTPAEEAVMVAKHASQTSHSRHIPNKQGYACAIDVAAMVDGAIAWEPVELYSKIAAAMEKAAAQLGIPIEWGGDWHTLKDFGHFQLPWESYP